MKLALLIALSPDRRSGRVLSGLIPADQATAQVKQAIAAGGSPEIDSTFNTLAAVDVGYVLRQHRFADAPAPKAKKPVITGDFKGLKKADLEKHLTAAVEHIAVLEERLQQVDLINNARALRYKADQLAKIAAEALAAADAAKGADNEEALMTAALDADAAAKQAAADADEAESALK